jgi:hypothetical protein
MSRSSVSTTIASGIAALVVHFVKVNMRVKDKGSLGQLGSVEI